MQKPARLMLADGLEFHGTGLYEGDGLVAGELVFSTSSTGYTEILTDPSYYGQIVVLAHTEVGNYGVNVNDFQSAGIKARALVVRNLSSCTSSFRAQMTLADFLLRERIPVLFGIDTRALISHLRDFGSTMAVISVDPLLTSEELYYLARSVPPLEAQKLSDMVSVKRPEKAWASSYDIQETLQADVFGDSFHVVAIDFGIKAAMLHYLRRCGASVTLVPNDITLEEIWSLKPAGLFLSNGPGDPEKEQHAVKVVRALLGKLPIFGVCMGHQILAQSLLYKTFKMKFGHRGSNQAVRRADGSIITTAQNHGFAVDVNHSSLANMYEDVNVADGTNEGIDLPSLYAFSVQFHPEGAPGPQDSLIYFEKFMNYMYQWQRSRADEHTRRIPGQPR